MIILKILGLTLAVVLGLAIFALAAFGALVLLGMRAKAKHDADEWMRYINNG